MKADQLKRIIFSVIDRNSKNGCSLAETREVLSTIDKLEIEIRKELIKEWKESLRAYTNLDEGMIFWLGEYHKLKHKT